MPELNAIRFETNFKTLCELTGSKYDPKKQEAYFERLQYKPQDLINKTFEYLFDNADRFPTMAAFIERFQVIKSTYGEVKVEKSCDWCEQGLIYFVATWDKTHKSNTHWDSVGACGICHPYGLPCMQTIDPRQHEALAVRVNEAGGPLMLDPGHLQRFNMVQQGVDPDEMIPAAEALQLIKEFRPYMYSMLSKVGTKLPYDPDKREQPTVYKLGTPKEQIRSKELAKNAEFQF